MELQILVMVMGANLGDGDGCKSWWWGESDSVLNWLSVTLLYISSRTVADGGISSLGSITDSFHPEETCGDLLPSWEWQSGDVRIWSISPVDGILTTPRHPLNVASSNTRDKDVNAPSLSFYSNLSPSQGSWCWILYFWRIQSTGMVLVGKKPSWLP